VSAEDVRPSPFAVVEDSLGELFAEIDDPHAAFMAGLAALEEIRQERVRLVVRLARLERMMLAALRYNGHLAECPQDGPCESLCQDFRAALAATEEGAEEGGER